MAADSPGECGDAELFEALRKRIFAESEEEEEEAPFIAPPVEAPEEEEDAPTESAGSGSPVPTKEIGQRAHLLLDQLGLSPDSDFEAILPRGARGGTRGAAPERRRNGSRSRSRGSRVEPAGARDAAERASQLEKMPMQLEKPYQEERTEEQILRGVAELTRAEQELEELRTRSLARAALADGTTAPSLAAVEAELEEGRATTHDRPASPGALEDRLRWLSEELRGDLKPRGLKSLADRIHKEILRRGGEEAPYKVMALLGKAFAKNAKPSGRKLIFYLCNELCRPTVKAPTNGHSKLLRHAVWGFLKAMTACTTDLTDDERSHFVRFLRRHSSSTDEASFIWRAAGEGKDAHDWQRRLTQWEAALMSQKPMDIWRHGSPKSSRAVRFGMIGRGRRFG
ncbi:unnamed protein product [Durusdinium trenchii]|uniref:Uncharacterized protein n=2 Tax=Durusdinium trenchii TaxID=1381693 RepID=A0ABP0HSB9_9DINO